MIPVGCDEILSWLPGSCHCYNLFRNYILRLHLKSFILARQYPSFVLLGQNFILPLPTPILPPGLPPALFTFLKQGLQWFN